MTSAFVLVVTIATGLMTGGVSIHTEQFDTKEQCQAVGSAIIKQTSSRYTVNVSCVEI